MNRLSFLEITACMSLCILLTGCEGKVAARENTETGPVASAVVPDMDASHVTVDHPEQFPLATAGEYMAAPEINATGSVAPDVSRQVPVPSLASGRVVEIDARLGDAVKKG